MNDILNHKVYLRISLNFNSVYHESSIEKLYNQWLFLSRGLFQLREYCLRLRNMVASDATKAELSDTVDTMIEEVRFHLFFSLFLLTCIKRPLTMQTFWPWNAICVSEGKVQSKDSSSCIVVIFDQRAEVSNSIGTVGLLKMFLSSKARRNWCTKSRESVCLYPFSSLSTTSLLTTSGLFNWWCLSLSPLMKFC